MKSVYSAVRTGSLNKTVCASSVKGYSKWFLRLLDVSRLNNTTNVMGDFNGLFFKIHLEMRILDLLVLEPRLVF